MSEARSGPSVPNPNPNPNSASPRVTRRPDAEMIWRRAVSPGSQDVVAALNPSPGPPGGGPGSDAPPPGAPTRRKAGGSPRRNSEHDDDLEDADATHRSGLGTCGTDHPIGSSRALRGPISAVPSLLLWSSRVHPPGFLCIKQPPISAGYSNRHCLSPTRRGTAGRLCSGPRSHSGCARATSCRAAPGAPSPGR